MVLDEPASAFDLANQGIMLRLLRRLARERGLAILFTTHHPDHALGIADQALLMLEAGTSVCGPASDALSAANLERLYAVPVRRISSQHEDQRINAAKQSSLYTM